MTARIVTEYTRQPIDTLHPIVGSVSGDRVAYWPRVSGQLWERLGEARND